MHKLKLPTNKRNRKNTVQRKTPPSFFLRQRNLIPRKSVFLQYSTIIFLMYKYLYIPLFNITCMWYIYIYYNVGQSSITVCHFGGGCLTFWDVNMCVNELQKPCALFVDVRMIAKEQWQVAATSNSFVSFFFDFNFFISVLLSSKIKISVLSTCSYENRYFKDFS